MRCGGIAQEFGERVLAVVVELVLALEDDRLVDRQRQADRLHLLRGEVAAEPHLADACPDVLAELVDGDPRVAVDLLSCLLALGPVLDLRQGHLSSSSQCRSMAIEFIRPPRRWCDRGNRSR